MAFGDIITETGSIDGTDLGELRDVGGDANVANINSIPFEVEIFRSNSDFTNILTQTVDDPDSIGGDQNSVYVTRLDANNTTQIESRSTTDLSIINSKDRLNVQDVGGSESVIWSHNDDDWRELSPSDFSVVSSTATNGDYNNGVGGDADVFWTNNEDSDGIVERSPSDFTEISSTSVGNTLEGLGGGFDTLYTAELQAVQKRELPVRPPSAPTNLSATLQ